ncbi:MAG: hypothetical protein OXE81_06010 [Gammaproteobacteria bacterium]|nr:hypothetical protein [Gammaproteobacteria bacterium]MCY4323957.1 hypothetical protein [Gammaproteobacteria bacterium]
MAGKVIVGLVALAAILNAVPAVPGELVMLALAILGLIHGYVGVDDDSASSFAIGAVALAAAGQLDVMSNIQMIGAHLDMIVDGLVVAALSAVVTRAVLAIVNRFTADS